MPCFHSRAIVRSNTFIPLVQDTKAGLLGERLKRILLCELASTPCRCTRSNSIPCTSAVQLKDFLTQTLQHNICAATFGNHWAQLLAKRTVEVTLATSARQITSNVLFPFSLILDRRHWRLFFFVPSKELFVFPHLLKIHTEFLLSFSYLVFYSFCSFNLF